LQCSFGTKQATLVVLPDKRVMAENQPVANIADATPMKNITTFGQCSSIANPVVASATAAAQGTLTPQACMPATGTPWAPGALRTLVANQPALTDASQCMCTWAGVVTVSQAGTKKSEAN